MRAFLGPIHYWMYNKIQVQEKMTEDISNLAVNRGWITEKQAEEYKGSSNRPLEEAIDLGNIHGWLQGMINDAEGKYASLVSRLLNAEKDRMEALKVLAFEEGKNNSAREGSSAFDIYKDLDDALLNGMPCDRINVVNRQEENCVAWDQTQDIHRTHWDAVGGNPDWYYELRLAYMKGVASGAGFDVVREGSTGFAIVKAA